MDALDYKIIELLQIDGRCSIKEISNTVHLTPPAVSERIRKLETEGVIKGYTAIIDPEKIGRPIKAIINVKMQVTNYQAFYKLVDECNEIVECHHVTGTYCMTLKIIVKKISELEEVLDKIQQLGITNTQMILSSHLTRKPII